MPKLIYQFNHSFDKTIFSQTDTVFTSDSTVFLKHIFINKTTLCTVVHFFMAKWLTQATKLNTTTTLLASLTHTQL